MRLYCIVYDSDESTVETVLSTVEDKEEEEKKDKFIACSTCGAKYKFLPTSKVPEDIFPPQMFDDKPDDISLSVSCRVVRENVLCKISRERSLYLSTRFVSRKIESLKEK
jgi:hypothetical protein